MSSPGQFEAIVSEHYQMLFRFAMSLTRSESNAGDLTQETFLIWASKGHQLRDASKARTWLFTTLHRLFLKGRRKESRLAEHSLDEMSEEDPALFSECFQQSDATNVLAALASVDEVYQAAVALFYLKDFSYKEIAAILQIPVGTVKSRIARGVEQLRDILLPGKIQKLHAPQAPPESNCSLTGTLVPLLTGN